MLTNRSTRTGSITRPIAALRDRRDLLAWAAMAASAQRRRHQAAASAPARREPIVLLAIGLMALVISGIGPQDRLTWWLEVTPVVIGVPLLVATWRRFPLTPLLYRLLLLHALILMLGGHYTYAEVPLGEWARDWFGFARNHYDRVGHLAQGFIPAILAREILLRKTPLRQGGWLFLLVTSVCLAFSAFYELIEWWSAVFLGGGATAFLGTQGDPWDTQWDMFLALIGAIVSQLLLGGLHDRQLRRFARGVRPT
jgi:putative membrane protein